MNRESIELLHEPESGYLINGDTTLDDPHKKVWLTEQVFHELMFDVNEL